MLYENASAQGCIDLGGRLIGPGSPTLFLPDIGTFFNHDAALAIAMIARLKDAGAEIVKGEILHDPNICLSDDTEEVYFSLGQRRAVAERYRDLIERKVLPLSTYERIFKECKTAGLPFVLSVYDFAGAEFARDIGAAGLKIASSNVVHEPLIRYVARLGLPVFIDTGRTTFSEIARAVDWARDAGATELIMEHSPPPPPAPVEEQNLRVIQTFEAAFGCPVGLSDHHSGVEMLYGAVALGACVVEKGICANARLDDQDVSHALAIERFAEVNHTCQLIHKGLGTGQMPRVRGKKTSRMCLTAGSDLAPGGRLSLEATNFAFPAKGIPVECWELVQGWRLRRAVAKGTPITWADVEPDG